MHRVLLGTQRLQENLQSGAVQNGKTYRSHQLHFERLDYTVLRLLDYHINHIHPVITSAVMGASHDLRVSKGGARERGLVDWTVTRLPS